MLPHAVAQAVVRVRALVRARQPLQPGVLCDLQRHPVLRAELLELGHDAVGDAGRALGVEAVDHAAHEVDLFLLVGWFVGLCGFFWRGGRRLVQKGEFFLIFFSGEGEGPSPAKETREKEEGGTRPAPQKGGTCHRWRTTHLVLDRKVDKVGVHEHLVGRAELRVVPKKERRGRLVDVAHGLGVAFAPGAGLCCCVGADLALGLLLLGLGEGLLDRVGGGPGCWIVGLVVLWMWVF